MRRSSRSPRERGQILVIFVLALVAIIAGVGLVIDGGFAFAQRRSEQNAADLAAFAGANALLNGAERDRRGARRRGRRTATPTASGGVTVNVTRHVHDGQGGHHGAARELLRGRRRADQPGTSASPRQRLPGIPTKFSGVAPFILSQEVFDPVTGLPFDIYTVDPTDFTKTQGPRQRSAADRPEHGLDQPRDRQCLDQRLKDTLDGTAPINADLAINDYIGQQNNGVHNALFDSNCQPSINTKLAGRTSRCRSSVRRRGPDVLQ